MANAEAAMPLRFAQKFQIMRREIDEQQLPTRAQDPRRFGQNSFRIFQIVQHLMDDDQIGAIGLKRGVGDITLAHARIAHLGAIQIGTGHSQHVMRQIEALSFLGQRCKQGQHPACPGAEIDDAIKALPLDLIKNGLFDIGLWIVQGAEFVPGFSNVGKIGLGRMGPGLANGLQRVAIG